MRNIYLLLFMLFCIIKTKGQYQVMVQSGHTQPVIDIASGGVGNECLFTASMDGTIKVWEWKTGSLMGTLKSNNQSEIIAIQMNSQGFLLVIYSDGKIEWWDYYEKKIRYEMQVHYDVVEVIKPIATSKYLILDDEYNDDTLDIDSRKILNTRNSKWVDKVPYDELINSTVGSNWIAGINTLNQGTFVDFSNESNPRKMNCLVEDTSDLLAICKLGGDTSLAVLSNNGYLHFFNKSGKPLFQKNTTNQNLKHLKSNNDLLMVVASEKEVLAYNNSGTLLDTFSLQIAIERIEFIADAKILITTASTLSIYNLHTHKVDVEVKTKSSISAYAYNSDLNLLVYVEKESSKPVVLDISHGIKIYTLTSPVWEAQQIYFTDSLNICLRNSKNECRMLNTSTGRISETGNCTSPPLDESLYIDNNYISLSYPIITYDSIRPKKINQFIQYRVIEITDFSGKAISSCFSTDSSKLYILNAENKITQFNRFYKEDNKIKWKYKSYLSFYPLINDNWAAIFNDNMYSCSKESLRWMALKYQNDDYSIEEMDLFNNRPDKTLQRLGNTDTALINIYYKAFQKRLKRNGLDTTILGKPLYRPIVEIKNRDDIPATVLTKTLSIKVLTTCRKANLKSLHILINEVPIFGSSGITLNNNPTKKDEREITIELNPGINEIKIQAIDENGVHSLYDKIKTNCTAVEGQKDLYVLINSVSHYQDERMNLKYAVKDGKDLAEILQQDKRYKNIFIDTLFDSKATRQQILDAKKKLSTSKPEDDVLVYFSGHGVLDKDLNFFYATWDIDAKNPSNNGLSYAEIDWLLDSIPARNKLLLLDACHSGEVDKEEVSTTENKVAKAESSSVKKIRGSELLETGNGHLGMQTTFELMSEMFSELNSNNGVVVISAAAGNSYALESDDWQNGVFTYSILQGIKSRQADLNKDGEISVLELKKYTGKTVQTLTDGRQKPTSRVENSRLDWRLF